MAIPAARVKIEILKLIGVPAIALGPGDTRFAQALIGNTPFLKTGRSRPIPAAGGDFDLTAEDSPWVFELNMNPGNDVPVEVDLAEDRGDAFRLPITSSTGKIADPWTPGVRTLGASPGIQVRVTRTQVNPTDVAWVARANAAAKASASLVVPRALWVEIVDVLGLYRPNPAATPGTPGATRVVGYASEDNEGRIFTNRLPDGAWSRDTQFIDVKVKVTALGGATIPAGAKLKWTIADPDDPTNDARWFHRAWGPYVDANDYNAAGAPLGAHRSDNTAAFSAANADEGKLFGAAAAGSPTARWARTPTGPAVTGSSRAEARSDIVGAGGTTGTSEVRIHCPNVLGTNLILKAGMDGVPAPTPVFEASTGLMTMWSRLDVQVVRMAGAHSVAGALLRIPPFLRPACVQLDFQPERAVSNSAAAPGLDRPAMATTDSTLTAKTRQWINLAQVFTHKNDPGWFFLGIGRLDIPLPSAGGPLAPLHTTRTYTVGTTGTDGWVEVDAALSAPPPDYVEFKWVGAGGKSVATGAMAAGSTTLTIDPGGALFAAGDVGSTVEVAGAAAGGATLFMPIVSFTSPTEVELARPNASGAAIAGKAVKWPVSEAGFGVQEGRSTVSGGKTKIMLWGNDVTPGFTGHDANGSLDHAYSTEIDFFPADTLRSGVLSAGGFGVPAVGATVDVWGPGAVSTSGISPSVPAKRPGPGVAVGAGSFFAGRTVLFSHHSKFSTTPAPPAPPAPRANFDALVVQTVVHEFLHAFGMPHKCGQWNWRTPREHSCCMNYFNTWLLDSANNLVRNPAFVGLQDNEMCGRHLMEIRRVHLERNLGLAW